MRPFLACLSVLIAGLWLSLTAAPVASPEGDKPALPDSDAGEYAAALLHTGQEIARRYVRPVAEIDLIAAALSGLYEGARQPIPPGLRGDVERAVKEGRLLPLAHSVRARLGNLEELRGERALLASVRAMCRCLDFHSVLVDGSDLLRGTGREINSGVGLELHDNAGAGPIRIKAVVPGGPAQKAGLLPGDEIARIDDRPMERMSTAEALVYLNRMSPGAVVGNVFERTVDRLEEQGQTPMVKLTLRREGVRAPWSVTLEQQEFHAETVLGVIRKDDGTWDYLLDRKRRIAHIRLSRLGADTPDDLRQVLAGLKKQDARGLLLDLRWCPGGLLQSAVDVAGLFLKEGMVVATVRNREQEETKLLSGIGDKVHDLPIVVLVNGETSGGAELIAAALQDHKRAVVAGQRTIGKGSIQTMLALTARDAGLKLTTATFVRSGGKGLHRFSDSKPADDWGVRPEPGLEARVSPEMNRQLREWWVRQTLRPGTSNQTLPLDDPELDAPRQEALQALAERLAGAGDKVTR